MAGDDIRRYSVEELPTIRNAGGSLTRADAPDIEMDESFWENVHLIEPEPNKGHTGIQIDSDVVAWFKAQGSGWQARMNAVLRAYVAAHSRDTRGE
jgi:uncharacterized protein (DUF4415 family)